MYQDSNQNIFNLSTPFIRDKELIMRQQDQFSRLILFNQQNLEQFSSQNQQLDFTPFEQKKPQQNLLKSDNALKRNRYENLFYQNSSSQRQQIYQSQSDQQDNNNIQINTQTSNQTKQVKNRNKLSSKKYRDKRRQYIKSLQEQNRFLKHKVDQLSFRLNEAQLLINKLKYGTAQSHNSHFQKNRDQCIKQIQQKLSSQNLNNQQIAEIEQKLYNLIAFSGKQKVNLLNYHMSELLQHAVQDRGIYWLNCFLQKKGVYRQSVQTPLRKIDRQMFQIYNLPQTQPSQKFFQRQISMSLINSAIRFKQIWQYIYLYYLKLLNEGLLIQKMGRQFGQKIKNNLEKTIPLKVQLYFEKIKYRSDIRELRKDWFKQLNSQEDIKRQLERVEQITKNFKKIKV